MPHAPILTAAFDPAIAYALADATNPADAYSVVQTGGVVGLLLLVLVVVLVGGRRRWWVWGWAYDEKVRECDAERLRGDQWQALAMRQSGALGKAWSELQTRTGGGPR